MKNLFELPHNVCMYFPSSEIIKTIMDSPGQLVKGKVYSNGQCAIPPAILYRQPRQTTSRWRYTAD